MSFPSFRRRRKLNQNTYKLFDYLEDEDNQAILERLVLEGSIHSRPAWDGNLPLESVKVTKINRRPQSKESE